MNHIYLQKYGGKYQNTLIEEMPNYEKCLKKTKIDADLRSTMVDWIIEVYGNYIGTSTEATLFRAIGVLDLYLKNETEAFLSGDLHLLGVASIFIATKIEDIYHLSLSEMRNKISHMKFSEENIK